MVCNKMSPYIDLRMLDFQGLINRIADWDSVRKCWFPLWMSWAGEEGGSREKAPGSWVVRGDRAMGRTY